MSFSLSVKHERYLKKLARKPETILMRLPDAKIYDVPREFAHIDFQCSASKDYIVRHRRCRFIEE